MEKPAWQGRPSHGNLIYPAVFGCPPPADRAFQGLPARPQPGGQEAEGHASQAPRARPLPPGRRLPAPAPQAPPPRATSLSGFSFCRVAQGRTRHGGWFFGFCFLLVYLI